MMDFYYHSAEGTTLDPTIYPTERTLVTVMRAMSRYPRSVSALKLTRSPNPFSDYSLDWTSPNLSVYWT